MQLFFMCEILAICLYFKIFHIMATVGKNINLSEHRRQIAIYEQTLL